MMMMMTMIIAW